MPRLQSPTSSATTAIPPEWHVPASRECVAARCTCQHLPAPFHCCFAWPTPCARRVLQPSPAARLTKRISRSALLRGYVDRTLFQVLPQQQGMCPRYLYQSWLRTLRFCLQQ